MSDQDKRTMKIGVSLISVGLLAVALLFFGVYDWLFHLLVNFVGGILELLLCFVAAGGLVIGFAIVYTCHMAEPKE